jgi:hypothetical protein
MINALALTVKLLVKSRLVGTDPMLQSGLLRGGRPYWTFYLPLCASRINFSRRPNSALSVLIDPRLAISAIVLASLTGGSLSVRWTITDFLPDCPLEMCGFPRRELRDSTTYRAISDIAAEFNIDANLPMAAPELEATVPRLFFQQVVNAIRDSDAVITVFSGGDVSAGVESGIALSLGKKQLLVVAEGVERVPRLLRRLPGVQRVVSALQACGQTRTNTPSAQAIRWECNQIKQPSGTPYKKSHSVSRLILCLRCKFPCVV